MGRARQRLLISPLPFGFALGEWAVGARKRLVDRCPGYIAAPGLALCSQWTLPSPKKEADRLGSLHTLQFISVSVGQEPGHDINIYVILFSWDVFVRCWCQGYMLPVLWNVSLLKLHKVKRREKCIWGSVYVQNRRRLGDFPDIFMRSNSNLFLLRRDNIVCLTRIL